MPVPNAPLNLAVSQTTLSAITWTWDAVAGATHYLIQHRIAGTAQWRNVTQPVADGNAYTLGSLAPSTSIDLQVAARNADGDGAYSGSVTGTTLLPDIAGLTVEMSSTAATLRWMQVSAATGYSARYKRRSEAAYGTPINLTSTSHAFSGLAASTAYDFEIRAFNAHTHGGWISIGGTTLGAIAVPAENYAPITDNSRMLVVLRDASGNRLGHGPLAINSFEYSQKLSKAGTWKADLFASIEDIELVRYPHQVEFFEVGSPHFLGIGLIEETRWIPLQDGHARVEISGFDQLRELAFVRVPDGHLNVNTQYTHATALDRLETLASGWTFLAAPDPEISSLQWHLEQQSLLQALSTIAELTGTNFLLSADKEVRFIGDAVSTDYVATAAAAGDNTYFLRLDSNMEIKTDARDVVTRLTPLDGEGNGMERANRAVPSGFALSSDRRTLINTTAEANSGIRREYLHSFSQVRPDTNSLRRRAANALFDGAVEFLRNHSSYIQTYQADIDISHRQRIPPLLGRSIRIVYLANAQQRTSILVTVQEYAIRISRDAVRTISANLTTGKVASPVSNEQLVRQVNALREFTNLTGRQLVTIIDEHQGNDDWRTNPTIDFDQDDDEIELTINPGGDTATFDADDIGDALDEDNYVPEAIEEFEPNDFSFEVETVSIDDDVSDYWTDYRYRVHLKYDNNRIAWFEFTERHVNSLPE